MSAQRVVVIFLAILAFERGAESQDNLGDAWVFDNGDGVTMPYRLVKPPETAPRESYPLIVFLHGSGERGTDNTAQVRVHINGLLDATQTDEFASFLIAPQLPSGDTFWHPSRPYDRTMDILNQVVAEYPVDQSRIYVTGLSLGGNGSFNYMASFPDVFAAAVPLSGWGNTGEVAQYSDHPIWTFHGDADSAVNVSGSRDMYYALDAAGGSPLHTDIQRGSHVIWSPIYSDWSLEKYGLYPWLFEKSLPVAEHVALIDGDAAWRILDDGSDQGTSWRDLDYDDSAWKDGIGQFGYGESDQQTEVNCGPSAPDCNSDNYATTYFRREFQVDDPRQITALTAVIVRDDSAAIFVNGIEVFRDSTLASDAGFDVYAGNGENSHEALLLDPGILRNGSNVVAVEIHQRRANDRDLSFDFRLNAQLVPEPCGISMCLLGIFSILKTARGSRNRRAS